MYDYAAVLSYSALQHFSRRCHSNPSAPVHVNKFAQSNLGRGPRGGAVACVRPIGPFGQWSTPNLPPKVPLPVDRSPNLPPASSLDPSDLRCQTESGSDPPFFHNALDRQTDRPTNRSFTGKFDDYIGRCAPRATRPNNNNKLTRLPFSRRQTPAMCIELRSFDVLIL